MTEWDDIASSKREILVGKILGWAFAAPSGVFLLRWLFAILKRDRCSSSKPCCYWALL